MKRDLITLTDFSTAEINKLIADTVKLKKRKGERLQTLKGQSIGLLFQKPSNRTRVSFEVGIWKLGGNCIYLGPHEINLGKRESTEDVAKTLSRYLDCIVARTNLHSDLTDLGKFSSISVINGLSDLYHPCQALADIFSIYECFGKFNNLTVSYVGDGNNVCHSLLLASCLVGMNMQIATPKGYEPHPEVLKQAKAIAKKTKSEILISNNPKLAVKKAHVIYADVWTSMGQESEEQERLNIFKPFQINKKLTSLASKNYIFMHCLPAHRGQEVTKDIIDGKHSIVFDQAENRMHVQKAILQFLLSKKKWR